MKIAIRITIFYLILMVVSVSAQLRDEYDFVVSKGAIVITPAFCFARSCERIESDLSGSFSAFLPGGGQQIFFTRSELLQDTGIEFQLPQNPNQDSGGTVRDITFEFDGRSLSVKGVVDSRAFDGPLIEYTIIASVSDVAFESESKYYLARPDLRRCVFPVCGGYLVREVNRNVTQCADGSMEKECYVAELIPRDVTTTAFDAPVENSISEDNLFLRGKLELRKFDGFDDLGVFVVDKAYRAVSDASAVGRFYSLENIGVVCITTPCFSYEQTLLNLDRARTVSSINLDRVSTSPKDLEEAWELLAAGEPLPALGTNRRTEEEYRTGIEFVATQFFLPLYSTLNSDCEPDSENSEFCE